LKAPRVARDLFEALALPVRKPDFRFCRFPARLPLSRFVGRLKRRREDNITLSEKMESLVFSHTLEAAATCAQSPCLLERVKHLLNQQKIRDARKALELGSIKFPENREIANLLCVVSPGRVVEIDRVSIGRHREISWIKQHGHKYRGKWIALDGDVLVAFAENLRELDGKIVILHQKEQPVFVHYLSNG
ncbi:MAG: DUF5678 domain-containing protein, partial [Roseovarius sp.]|nr:DUF5678 domain-containing protein [Roseovarius sp.]